MGVDRKEVVTEYRARALGLPGREWGARLMSLEEESEESLHLIGRKCKSSSIGREVRTKMERAKVKEVRRMSAD